MSICINSRCPKPENSGTLLFCQGCGSELLLVGRYRVTQQLGGGGFGKTFEVSNRDGRPKVLKVLINNHPKYVELFQREAQVLSHLNHPGIPQVEPDAYFTFFPRDSTEPLHCLVMEKIEGLDLSEYLQHKGSPIDQKLAIQWLTQLANILQEVHSQNFFHRDIKPQNIMLRSSGHLVLIDFGTARAVTGTFIAKQALGQVTGVVSAGYTPPEQFNGQAVPQSDFFALGRTFVYLLTGKDPSELYDPHTDELHWHNAAVGVSPVFADFLDQMMARLPSQRPQTAETVAQRLAEINSTLYPSKVHPQPTQPVTNPVIAPTQPVSTPQPTPLANKPGVAPTQPVSPPQTPLYSPPPTVPPQYRQETPVQPEPLQSHQVPTQARRVPSTRSFWLQWVLATAVSGAMGWAVSYSVFFSSDFEDSVLNIVVTTLVGTSVGIAQWFVLRRQVPQTGLWVLATAVGEAVGLALSVSLFQSLYETMPMPLVESFYGAVIGVLVGIGQWLVLRRQIAQTGWWVLATTLGKTVGGIIGWGIINPLFFPGEEIPQIGLLILGIAIARGVTETVSAAITGGVMVWLLRRSVAKQSNHYY
jgi:serine/threonine protein kinase